MTEGPITGGTWWIIVTRLPITEDGDVVTGLDPLPNYAFGPFASQAEATEEMESDSGQIFMWLTDRYDWMVHDVFLQPDTIDHEHDIEPEIFYPANGESTYIHQGFTRGGLNGPGGAAFGWWCRCGAQQKQPLATLVLARHDGDKHLEVANSQKPPATTSPIYFVKEATRG